MSDFLNRADAPPVTGVDLDEEGLDGFTPETDEEMLSLGRLGTYRGTGTVRLCGDLLEEEEAEDGERATDASRGSIEMSEPGEAM